MKKFLLWLSLILIAILIFFMTGESGMHSPFPNFFPWLVLLSILIVLFLIGLIVIQIRHFLREYRQKKFGSRLRYRLLIMFCLLAIIPGIVIYTISAHFVVRTIDSWFDVRVENALVGGVELGKNSLKYLKSQLVNKASSAILEINLNNTITATQLDRIREQLSVSSASIISPSGVPLLTSSNEQINLLPTMPKFSELRQAKRGRIFEVLDQNNKTLVLRVIIQLPTISFTEDSNYLQLTQNIPSDLANHISAVQEAYADYQEIVLSRNALRQMYLLTLTLSMFIAVLFAVVVAFLLTRKLAAPLRILAEGTKAVAQGDFRQLKSLPAKDELAILTHSFNSMMRQLEEARILASDQQEKAEAARAYLENILENISTGVLVFNNHRQLKVINPSAIHMLNDDFNSCMQETFDNWKQHRELKNILINNFAHGHQAWHEQIEIERNNKSIQFLLVHGTRLSYDDGYVVVFDDMSQMVQAQRATAWGEVARRMAHEIKNPLTPIQLSAERLSYKLEGQLSEESEKILHRSIQTIVTQVEHMKNLVNAFRDYAKLPNPTLVPLDLNRLIQDVLDLYEATSINIQLELSENMPVIWGDSGQLRQILHNVLQNTEDALEKIESPVLLIKTAMINNQIELTFKDNGLGFPQELLSRVFEPYFTTKVKGSGLGLAIIKKIVDEHGGEINLYNGEHGGAIIKIGFKIVKQE